MKKQITFLTLLIFFAMPVFGQDFETLVIDGDPVPASSAISRSMLMVLVQGGTCSGVAITRTHVLTAGHCVDTRPATRAIEVYSGATKRFTSPVKSYVIHPGYGYEGRFMKGDLAILTMTQPFGSDVVPAPITTAEPSRGLELIAAGFGYADHAKTKRRTLLQAKYVFGETAFFKAGSFSDGSRLFLYQGPQALCNGDSGGATFRRTASGIRTVGIHSMADCRNYGFDVFVKDYAGWIHANSR